MKNFALFAAGLCLAHVPHHVDAEACSYKMKMLAATISLQASVAHGGFDMKPLQLKWPYDNTAFVTSLSPRDASMGALVDLAHTRYENLFFNEGLSAIYQISDFRADQSLSLGAGPQWVATSGGWNSLTLDNPPPMPLGVMFGTQVIYDPTPHTPNLYQFTEVDWSQYPFRIRVTHRAWVLMDPLKDLSWNQATAHLPSTIIPSPASGGLFLTAALLNLRRKSRLRSD